MNEDALCVTCIGLLWSSTTLAMYRHYSLGRDVQFFLATLDDALRYGDPTNYRINNRVVGLYAETMQEGNAICRYHVVAY